MTMMQTTILTLAGLCLGFGIGTVVGLSAAKKIISEKTAPRYHAQEPDFAEVIGCETDEPQVELPGRLDNIYKER